MRYSRKARYYFTIIAATILIPGISAAATREMALDYQYRYNCQPDEADHLLDAIAIDGGRALVAGNRGIAMVNLSALTVEGTQVYIYRLSGLNARNLYVRDGQYLYVNLNRGETMSSPGFAILRIEPSKLTYLRTIEEPGALYEKMLIDGDYLYVAAHNKGLRIFSLSNPESPALTGSLATGFDDAWAVAVKDNYAYVADGASGLKIVDIKDKSHPVLVDGENPDSVLGTAEDVTVGPNGDVYIAAGGAGLLTYRAGSLLRRTPTNTGGSAKHIRWLGKYLVVATMAGVVVVEPRGTGRAKIVADEIMGRRGKEGTNNAVLRICSAAGVGPENLILCADWNFMDVYRLRPISESTQPDITCSVERIRFPRSGGTYNATVRNDGGKVLNIAGVSSQYSSFTTTLSPRSLQPGESASFDIRYDGSAARGTDVIRISSDDPDEAVLPIQVFGNTNFLDPGEPAADFTLPLLSRNSDATLRYDTFNLLGCRGKIVWFHICASW